MFTRTLVVALEPYISIPPVFTQNKTLFWMLVGRFFFGLGSESLIVAQSAIIDSDKNVKIFTFESNDYVWPVETLIENHLKNKDGEVADEFRG